MARDGLLPSFFSDVNRRSQVPVKSTLVSVGTLLAFTMVAISVLILRYVPPDEVPFPSSLQEIIDSVSLRVKNPQRDLPLGIGLALSICCCLYMMVSVVIVGLVPYYAMDPDTPISSAFAAYGMQWAASQVPVKSTLVTGLGSAVLAFFMDVSELAGMEIIDSVSLRYSTGCQNVTKEKSVCGIGGALLLIGLIVLTCIEQDDARHNFGHSGGFICPFVPLLPIVCSLVNIYLLINLGLPFFLARQHIPGLDVVVDPCAAVLVLVVTGLLCMGIKESTLAQAVVTSINVCAMIFIIIAGSYLGFKTGWAGYELPAGYFPFGVNGMLAGSATVFFAYIGFDSVASTAEERDLPLGIGLALSVCCCLYMMVSVVIVDVNRRSQVPVKSTLVTGLGSAVLAFFMDVSELAGMVSVGTLLAFTMVAISVLILRYVPPDEVPFPSSLQEIIDSVSLRYSTGCQNVTKERSGFYAVCGIGGALLLIGLIVLTCIEQDDARHNFGHSGGFICPFVPLLLFAATWTRVSVWLIVGVLVYTFYGRTHSSLRDAVYVPATHADEIYRSSGES
uniref:Cationic amino acid transporter C-terminal domain-containing protein n=1 Tax=Salix viminalis TaxID=40686 RepID=A0A6N2MNN8_SALVM